MTERIYLDSCVLNRFSDDQTQERVRLEAAAAARVLDAVARGVVHWVASCALTEELERNPNPVRRRDALRFLSMASETVSPTASTMVRADQLRASGIGDFDAIHLAIAEEAQVSALLSVDDRFIARSARRPDANLTLVENPIDWCRRRQPWLIKR